MLDRIGFKGLTREEILGQDGPVKQLTGRLLQRVLEAETDGHPGCEKHGSSGDNSGDSRNGYSGKTVATENQEPVVPIPRDRRGAFEPQLLPKYQQRGGAGYAHCLRGRAPARFSEAVRAVYPDTRVQMCIVPMVRNSTRFVWYQDLKKLCADLKAVYSAPAEQAGRDAMEGFGKIWNDTYPMLYPGRDRRRQDLGEFFTYPPEIRRGISTTHAVESLNYQLRKVTKKRPALVDDEAVYKILYLAIRKACGKRAVPIRGWGAELIRRYFRQGTGSVLNWTLPFTQKNLQAPSMTAN